MVPSTEKKGCNENCSIRPCLDWITNPNAQANATVFLAKFYGRAGFMNFINAGPNHLRPAIFRSLLYEACGRILNPIHGSVGLLWSGSWQLCQDAVEAVLNGLYDSDRHDPCPMLKAYDIRHVNKGEMESMKTGSNGLKRVRTRRRFKWSVKKNPAVEKDLLLGHISEPRNESLSSLANHDTNLGLLTRPEDDDGAIQATGFEG